MEREHITPQGVSIFHDKNENIHSFCLCLYVRAGSLFETKENNGISHFFEHIVFIVYVVFDRESTGFGEGGFGAGSFGMG